MAYWLFQGNPKYYRLVDAIKDFDEMHWLVTLYSQQIAVGDGVLVWIAGKDAGIYATAEIVEPAKVMNELLDKKYWIDSSRAVGKLHAKIRFTKKLLETPLLRTDLKKDPILQRLGVILCPNRTNYKVTLEEWQRVDRLLMD